MAEHTYSRRENLVGSRRDITALLRDIGQWAAEMFRYQSTPPARLPFVKDFSVTAYTVNVEIPYLEASLTLTDDPKFRPPEPPCSFEHKEGV